MKRTDKLIIILISIIFSAISSPALRSQERTGISEDYVMVDSIVYRPAAAVDTLLAGKDIFSLMPSSAEVDGAYVDIHQTDAVKNAVRNHVDANEERELPGYRVRIFFDNKQTARVESEEALKRFESLYHDVVAYRSYANPYFKVTVGDFRTKSEAYRLLERIRHEFPSAFVVKENIEYPVVDRDNAYVTDTVKVIRPRTSGIFQGQKQ